MRQWKSTSSDYHGCLHTDQTNLFCCHRHPRHCPLWGEFTGDRWIPRTKGQSRGKCFHLITEHRPFTMAYQTWHLTHSQYHKCCCLGEKWDRSSSAPLLTLFCWTILASLPSGKVKQFCFSSLYRVVCLFIMQSSQPSVNITGNILSLFLKSIHRADSRRLIAIKVISRISKQYA